MADLEVREPEKRKERRQGDNGASSAVSDTEETASQGSAGSKRRHRKRSHKKKRRSDSHSSSDDTSQLSKKEAKKRRKLLNGQHNGAAGGRRESISLPARDPRDSGFLPKPKPKPKTETVETRSPSPMVDFDGLSRPSRGTRARLEEKPDSPEAKERLEKMTGAMRTILECVGEDPERSGILDTPTRYAKAMLFFTKGYQENVHDIVNNAIFQEDHNEMVVVKSIDVFSLCEHHLVPFTGKMHIAYIPKGQVIGISKLPRIAEMFSRRLQIQERLTKEVANAIMEILKPQGVAVVMESSHLCMVMRGVQKTSATTITSCVLGCFERKSKTRNEFFSLVGMQK